MSTLLPLLAIPLAVLHHTAYPVTLRDILVFVVMSFVGMCGVTISLHRYLSHRAFTTGAFCHAVLLTLTGVVGQGPPLFWVAIHRRHHEVSDAIGDPHSPRPLEPTILGRIRGLWHAHFGWMFDTPHPDPARYCKDLLQDRAVCVANRWYFRIFLAGQITPAAMAFVLTHSYAVTTSVFLWGGPLRHLATSHLTWMVNSIGHWIGPRDYDTRDSSRNLAVLAIPTLGDSWHNNHHAFPGAAYMGHKWWQVDIGGIVIWLCERAGIVWNVKKARTHSH